MVKATLLIASFNAGEFSPRMEARVDFAKYRNACKTLENFLPLPQGGARRRAGWRFVAEVKDSTKATDVMRFEFSTTQAYILERGETYFRFYRNKGRIEDPPGAPVEIATPYLASELAGLQQAQTADIMYIVHPDHPTQKLSRTGHTSWTLTEVEFIDGPYFEANTDSAKTLTPSSVSGSVTITATGHSPFASTDVGRLVRIDEGSDHGYAKITAFTSATEVTADVKKNFVTTTAQENWRLGAWSATTGYPSCVAFYEQRLYLAGSKDKPQTLWGSKSAAFEDFTPGTVDDDPVNFTIAADEVNVIEWLSPGRRLIVGTAGGEWIVQATQLDDPITPTNIQVKRQTTHGSNSTMARRIGPVVLFIQRAGRKIRSLSFDFIQDSFTASDTTILAEHISRGLTVAGSGFKQIVYQQEPNSILWAVRADGVLAAMTFLPDQDVGGWARQTTGTPFDEADGAFEAIAVIPGSRDGVPDGQEDEVWCVVKRTIGGVTKRYIEFLESDDFDNQGDALYVDSGLSLNKWNTDSAKTLILTGSGPWTKDKTTSMQATGHTPFLAGDVDQLWMLGRGRDQVGVKITAFTSATDVTVVFLEDVPKSLQAIVTGDWLDPDQKVTAVSGLDHLEGRTVDILADGAVHPARVVSSGSVTLDTAAGKVQAGLNYASTIETLKIEAGAVRGTAIGQIKRVSSLTLVLLDSLGAKVGPNEANLDVVPFRSTGDSMDTAIPLFSGDRRILNASKFETDARIVIRQDLPLPLTVLAIVMSVTTHER